MRVLRASRAATLMHEDRLAQEAKSRRIAEATAKSPVSGVRGGYRAAVAKALLTLTTRLSPTVVTPNVIATP